MNRRIRLFLILSLFLIGFSALNVSCSSSSKPIEQCLKENISDYKLNESIVGTSAFQEIKKSHIGKLKAPEDAVIGYYEEGLTIWISEYVDKEESANETDRMASAIKSGHNKFGTLRTINIDNRKVYRLNVKNTYHYFWRVNEFIIYIVAGPLGDSYIRDELIPSINDGF